MGAEQEQGHGGAVVAASLTGLGGQRAHGAQGDGKQDGVTALHCWKGECCSARQWEARGELLLCQGTKQTSFASHAAVLNCSISHVWALLEQGLASSLCGSIPATPSWASTPGRAARQPGDGKSGTAGGDRHTGSDILVQRSHRRSWRCLHLCAADACAECRRKKKKSTGKTSQPLQSGASHFFQLSFIHVPSVVPSGWTCVCVQMCARVHTHVQMCA